MHSRIIEIKRNEDQLFYEEFLSECESNDIVQLHVDYVDESDREEDIKWLLDILPKGCFTYEDNVLTLVQKPNEFYEDFINKAQEMVNNLSLERADNYYLDFYNIKKHFFGGLWDTFVICSDDEEYSTLKEWLWSLTQMEIGTKFIIGGTCDYHN